MPDLPAEGLASFLSDLVSEGGRWATVALQAAWDALLQRPRLRDAMLQLVLTTATCECRSDGAPCLLACALSELPYASAAAGAAFGSAFPLFAMTRLPLAAHPHG